MVASDFIALFDRVHDNVKTHTMECVASIGGKPRTSFITPQVLVRLQVKHECLFVLTYLLFTLGRIEPAVWGLQAWGSPCNLSCAGQKSSRDCCRGGWTSPSDNTGRSNVRVRNVRLRGEFSRWFSELNYSAPRSLLFGTSLLASKPPSSKTHGGQGQ